MKPELQATLDIITDQYRQQFLRFEEEQRFATRGDSSPRSAFLDLSRRDHARWSWVGAVQAARPSGRAGAWVDNFEAECAKELRRRFPDISLGSIPIPNDILFRVLGDTPGSKGGFLVGQSAPAGATFVDLLRAQSALFQAGMRMIGDLKNDVSIPKITTAPTLEWISPLAGATAQEYVFGQTLGAPKTAVIVAEVSEQLLRQSASAADQILPVVLSREVALGIDKAGWAGTGGAQPLGICNLPGVVAQSGTSLNSGVFTMLQKVAEANATDPAIAFVSTPAVRALLQTREVATGGGKMVWQGDAVADRRAYVSTNMPSGTMIAGDFSLVWFAQWGPLQLSASSGGTTRFNAGVVGIRTLWNCDIIVSQPAAFCKATSIT